MKKALFTILTLLALTTVKAQKKSDWYGSWKINYNNMDTRILTLNKEEEDLEKILRFGHYGRFIEFFEDGTYREHASAQCGLDDNRYSYTGKWSFNPQTKIVELTEIKVEYGRPNIYAQYKVLSSGTLQLMSQEKKSMTVKITKAWEKVSGRK